MSGSSLAPLAYLDVLLIVVAAPIMILIGVPAAGYGIGAGAWLGLRAAGLAVERAATGSGDARMQISIRLGYMLARLFGLALAVIGARAISKDDGLAALGVVVVAFTVHLATSAVTRRGGAE